MKSIISWHRGALEKFMKYTNLDWYQLSWIGFIKGIILWKKTKIIIVQNGVIHLMG